MIINKYITGLSCLLILTSTNTIADDGTGNIECPIVPSDVQQCSTAGALLPDLMTVVPKHLGLQNKQQQEVLRFTNAMANLGNGPWWLEPEFPDAPTGQTCQAAYQLITAPEHFPDRHIIPTDEQIPAPAGTFLDRCQKGQFDYHETHNHWHIANVGDFKVCHYDEFIVGNDSNGKAIVDIDCAPVERPGPDPHDDPETIGVKFTFCLVDWYKLGDNSPNSDYTRNFFACETGFQGVAPGWADQYHHSTDGQDIDITGLAPSRYVLVSNVNAEVFGSPLFQEMDYDNNASWSVFDLTRESQGNPKIKLVEDACSDTYSFLETVIQPAAQRFVDYYHDGDERFRDIIIDDMCGGKTLNR